MLGDQALDFLKFNEIIQTSESEGLIIYKVTKLGQGIIESNQAPEEGLLIYKDLQKANQKLILSNELHKLYLLSPISMQFKVNWSKFHRFYKHFSEVEIKIANAIGITEDSIVMF
jgi:DNA polymerase theta